MKRITKTMPPVRFPQHLVVRRNRNYSAEYQNRLSYERLGFRMGWEALWRKLIRAEQGRKGK